MLVKVKLFATLTRFSKGNYSGAPFEIELPPGSTLQNLIDSLNIPVKETKVIFINGLIQPMDRVIQPGDEIGIFPPVGGG